MATIINGRGRVGVRTTVGPGGGGASYLLDTYGGAAAAYSLRKLSSTYSGNAIRVRRSSDNTEQNIGFDGNGNLDEASLTAFVGSGNGFVTTWFDQSGNGKNATQSTASSQPRIVASGTINKLGSIPYVETYGKNLINTQPNAAPQATFSVFQLETTGNDGTFALPFNTLDTAGFSSYYAGICSAGNTSSGSANFGSPVYYANNTSIGTTRADLYSAFATGTKKIASTLDGGNSVANRILQYASGLYGNFKLMESIIYNTDQSSNRTGIVGNMNTYYSIY